VGLITEVNEPVISWSEAIVDRLGHLRGQPVLLPMTPRRCMFDRRHKDLSGWMAWFTNQ